MYHRNIEEPTVFIVRTELHELANNTPAELRSEQVEPADEKLVLEVPTGGSLTFYADEQSESSYFVLTGGNDSETVQLSDLSTIEFDFRPDEDQYRFIVSGEKSFDFGL